MNDERWLSMSEICKYLGISRDTALKWINNKNMPAHKIGRLWKFKIEEIDNWVKSGSAE